MRPVFVVAVSLLGLAHASHALAGKHKKKKKEPEWRTEPYLRPQAGVSVFSNGESTTQAATVGGQAGLRYWQTRKKRPRWQGNARAQLGYVLSSGNASGYDVRVGNFVGPAWKLFGIQTGPDIFYSRYQYGSVVLDPTTGLAWPMIANAHVDELSVYAGVEPSWFLDSAREPVDWSQQDIFGFGDEFAWLAGVSLNLNGLDVGVGWQHRITAYGSQQNFGLVLNVSPKL